MGRLISRISRGTVLVAGNQLLVEVAVFGRNVVLARLLGAEQMGLALTLAIVQAQLVECGGQPFAIPASSVREVGRIAPAQGESVEWVQGSPTFRLRGEVFPLVDLGKNHRCSPCPFSPGVF